MNGTLAVQSVTTSCLSTPYHVTMCGRVDTCMYYYIKYNNIVGLSGYITGKHVYIAMCRSRTLSHGERAETTYDPNHDIMRVIDQGAVLYGNFLIEAGKLGCTCLVRL